MFDEPVPADPFTMVVVIIDGHSVSPIAFDPKKQHADTPFIFPFSQEANLCAFHAKRVTIIPKDIHLVNRIRQSR